MCGIAGYVGTRAIGAQAIDLCTERLRRRGPDESDVVRFDLSAERGACLINRRLRIIDLDARARQPFEHRGRCITYNGELYNYLELKRELEAIGVAFRTESDTEVLIAALGEWGLDALDRFEGMWAFAIADPAEGTVTLCRDRFGEKPLYLLRDATGLYFASEIKALQALSGQTVRPNCEQLHRYLVNGYRALYKTGETFFENVVELPPGTWLRIARDGRETTERYWTPRVCPDPAMGYDEAVRGVRERLTRSVELRLRADVPLAFCLSGGVDSNALAAIARRSLRYDVHAFTVVDPDPRYNEGAAAERAARALGVRHTRIPVKTDGFLDDLRELVRYHDGPVATISYFVHWKLMREVAASGYRVSVSGTAADELLSGYYDHHLFYLADVRSDRTAYDEARAAWEAHVKPLVRNPHLRDPDVFVERPAFRDHLYLDADVFAGYLTRPWREAFRERQYTPAGLLRNRMLNELFAESVPVILHEDDLNAMYYSIENRSPYLDRALFEFCGRIPTRHLIRNGFAKAVLRDAVRDVVPAEVVDNRRKIGFNASILSLVDATDPAVRQTVLEDSPIFDVVKREAVAALVDASDLPNSQSKFLFNVLNAKFFLEQAAAA